MIPFPGAWLGRCAASRSRCSRRRAERTRCAPRQFSCSGDAPPCRSSSASSASRLTSDRDLRVRECGRPYPAASRRPEVAQERRRQLGEAGSPCGRNRLRTSRIPRPVRAAAVRARADDRDRAAVLGWTHHRALAPPRPTESSRSRPTLILYIIILFPVI